MKLKELSFTCELINGLHARPASYLAREASPFNASLVIENQRNGRTANLKSVLSIIGADINHRDACLLTVSGEDAEEAFKRLQQFIVNVLPGCDDNLPETGEAGTLPPSLRTLNLKSCRGVPTGDGWASGVPVRLKEYRFLPGVDHAVYAGVTGERLRLLGAMEQVQAQLQSAVEQAELLAEREVLNAHLALAGDPDFRARLLEHVENGLSVAESIEATLEHFSQVLESSESGYLRDRVIDIRDLCDQLLRLSYGSGCLYSPDILTQDSICLADNLTPSQFMALDKRYLNGLVLESGGKASHTVLLARARGIPVVVGVLGARELMAKAREVVLDSCLGLLIADPSLQVRRYYAQEGRKQQRLREKCAPFLQKKARTRDGCKIEVGANIVGVEDAESAFAYGAEGIGLFRTEMMYMERSRAPDESEQLWIYSSVVRVARNKPVIIRTLDVGADKPVDYFQLDNEQNPFLGYRAVRLYPQFNSIFKIQLKAILRSAIQGNVRIMIPMVTCLDEVKWVQGVLNEVREEMDLMGDAYGDVETGIMVEVPSTCLVIDQMARYVDFFSIGSNDLAQYFLAADRGNEKVSELYSYLHPSFLRLLRNVVSDAHRHKRWVGLCGEMAAAAEVLPLLVGMGLDEISLPGKGIPSIKEKLSHLDSSECRKLLNQAVTCESLEQVRSLLQKNPSNISSRPVLDQAIIKLDCDCLTKEEAIKELVDMMYLDGRVSDSRAVEEATWRREVVYSTGLGNGIAIPHCQSDHVYSHSIGVLRLREPVDWQAMDNQPVDTVFLLGVRESGARGRHMKIFARLARKLVRATFLDEFKACTDEVAVMHLLRRELNIDVASESS
ncbi:MAG: phosphoenolpyruvate--protein phosphotransferase [Endozoicomonas sp.]